MLGKFRIPQKEELVINAEVSAPSNIALVKYWGKKNFQYPINPSLSLTLKHAQTKMKMQAHYREGFQVKVFFNGALTPSFHQKIENLIQVVAQEVPWLLHYQYEFHSENTFPHSAGIASSASSMAALAKCLAQMIKVNCESELSSSALSYIARLGSGSASRSVYAGYALWGECQEEYSSNDYAIKVKNIHPLMKTLKDVVLITDSQAKKKSSSAGHNEMDQHIFKDARITQANDNIKKSLTFLQEGNWRQLGELVEREALTLHALMMSSQNYFWLLSPASLEIMNWVAKIREVEQIECYFTIDAGPNIHLLYLAQDEEKLKKLVTEANLSLKMTLWDEGDFDE